MHPVSSIAINDTYMAVTAANSMVSVVAWDQRDKLTTINECYNKGEAVTLFFKGKLSSQENENMQVLFFSPSGILSKLSLVPGITYDKLLILQQTIVSSISKQNSKRFKSYWANTEQPCLDGDIFATFLSLPDETQREIFNRTKISVSFEKIVDLINETVL